MRRCAASSIYNGHEVFHRHAPLRLPAVTVPPTKAGRRPVGRLKARLLRDEPSLYVPPLILRHAYRRGVEGPLERSRTRR